MMIAFSAFPGIETYTFLNADINTYLPNTYTYN
jgi:hypothetical protein